jgi:hypothetical protein
MKPENFYGLPTEDIEEWLDRFDLISQHNAWDAARKLQILPLYLGGTAMLWFRTVGSQFTSYEGLRQKFLGTFASVNPTYYAQERLNQRMQGDKEPLETYAFAIQSLCSRVDKSMSDTMRRDHFLRGLVSELKEKVIPMQPPSFDEAYRLARLYEHAHKVSYPSDRRMVGMQVLEDYNPLLLGYQPPNPLLPPVPSEKQSKYGQLHHKGVHLIAKEAPVETSSLQDLINQVSALATEVRLLKDRMSKSEEETSRQNKYVVTTQRKNIPTCTYCHKVGHIEATCFQKNPSLRNNVGQKGASSSQAVKPPGPNNLN